MFEGTRELAFIYAMASAAVTSSVTKECSTGNMKSCFCERVAAEGTNPQTTYQYFGCSDNINYGVAFARSFVDARERGKAAQEYPARTLMNLHNNEAGRSVSRKNDILGIHATKSCRDNMSELSETQNSIRDILHLCIYVIKLSATILKLFGKDSMLIIHIYIICKNSRQNVDMRTHTEF